MNCASQHEAAGDSDWWCLSVPPSWGCSVACLHPASLQRAQSTILGQGNCFDCTAGTATWRHVLGWVSTVFLPDPAVVGQSIWARVALCNGFSPSLSLPLPICVAGARFTACKSYRGKHFVSRSPFPSPCLTSWKSGCFFAFTWPILLTPVAWF